jgi:DNA-directed RNA polymerase subunit RPC12/RpoP
MVHTCRNCKRTFATELQYELHRDTCWNDRLICTQCGERFAERSATEDGWHYRCPNEDCTAAGIGEDLQPIGDVLSVSQ